MDEYYGWIFENSVPGLPEAAKKEGLTPLQYMRKYGAFEVTTDVYKLNEKSAVGRRIWLDPRSSRTEWSQKKESPSA